MLLHDYGRLAVTTIDRFFQRIIKAFTRELGIFPGYNVELDSDFVLLKAVDKVMQQVKDNPGLKNWISELMSSNVEEGKSWSIKSKIALNKPTLKVERQDVYLIFINWLPGISTNRRLP